MSPGDTNMDQVWRIPNANIPTDGYTYNGQHYDKPGGDLIACGSNNLACGSSEECTNIKHPDVNNRGRSGQQQCTAYSYTRISLTPGSSPGTSGTVMTGGDKACINIGDYSSHFNELATAASTFPNGWVYILALPEWMDSISEFIGKHPSNNFMIRLHTPVAELSPDYANRWVDNLKKYASNITNKVYLMPVNEPNNSGDRRVEPNDARLFISALSQGLDNEGLLNTKYIVTSPMIDPTSSDVTGWLEDFCADGYCDQFAAVAVAPYDVTGDMSNITSYFPDKAPMIIAETGIKRGGEVVYGLDDETAGYITSQKDNWKSAVAACIFSYDPDRNTNQEWIYSATKTKQALLDLGQSIKPIAAPQVTPPKSERSTISYESCTELGEPETVSVVPIPNLASFGVTGTDAKTKKTFFSRFLDRVSRPIPVSGTGILGFEKQQAAEPSIFARFGAQLDRAMPYLTPLAINVQPIIQEYTHTVTSTLCFDSDNENKQAFPIKRIIQLPAPGLNKVLQNGRMMAGFIAPNVSVSKQEYEHLGELNPNVLANIDANPGCDEATAGRPIRRIDVASSDPEEYNVPPNKLPVYLWERWKNLIFNLPIIGKPCDEQNCNADANPAMNAHLKLKTPYISKIQRDLANDPTGKPIGALPTFVPGMFRFPNEHGKVTDLTIAQSVGSNSDPIRDQSLTYAYAKVQQNYIDFTNCAIRPGALQKDIDYSCNFPENFSENDVAPGRPLTGGTDPGFSGASLGDYSALTNGKIPACVLEAVKYIETGTKTDFSGECRVNECSAAGPFQVTTGIDNTGDSHCSQCNDTYKTNYKAWIKDPANNPEPKCPDGWRGDWPKVPTDPNPCTDFAASANRAVEMLQEKATIRCESLDTIRSIQEQKTAIITAAGSYFGKNNPIDKFGGCSYGEFVYKHCDGSYICGTANVDLDVKYEQCQKQKNL